MAEKLIGADGGARAVTPLVEMLRQRMQTLIYAIPDDVLAEYPDLAVAAASAQIAVYEELVEEAPPPAAIPPDVADALTAANDWLQSHGEQRYLTTHAVVTKLRDALASIVRAPAG